MTTNKRSIRAGLDLSVHVGRRRSPQCVGSIVLEESVESPIGYCCLRPPSSSGLSITDRGKLDLIIVEEYLDIFRILPWNFVVRHSLWICKQYHKWRKTTNLPKLFHTCVGSSIKHLNLLGQSLIANTCWGLPQRKLNQPRLRAEDVRIILIRLSNTRVCAIGRSPACFFLQ
jgi:hypothetical protein